MHKMLIKYKKNEKFTKKVIKCTKDFTIKKKGRKKQ